MYHGEVLSKFPVVQHFPFGNLFPWERDPHAPPTNVSGEGSKPSSKPSPSSNRAALHSQNGVAPARPTAPSSGSGTAAPWASSRGTSRPAATATLNTSARAPGARPQSSVAVNSAARVPAGMSAVPSTRAPWATSASKGNNASSGESGGRDAGNAPVDAATKAPWAK